MKALRTVVDIILIIASAVLGAIALYSFVNPANFAPSGIDGVAMMAQKLFSVNMGYVSLAINIPLLICAWFFINKKYVIYTALYTVTTSIALIIMEQINMYQYISQENTWIAVFASGIMLGVRTAVMIKIGGSSGGVDIVACIIQQNRPHINIEQLISILCYIIIGLSFFVYGNLESIIMAVAQMVIFNTAMGIVLKTTRNAIEVRIITDNIEKFREDILLNLKHGATVVDCKGMFTEENKKMIITIINIHQMNDLMKLSKKYPNSFIYFSEVNGVRGNFRWKKFDEVK